MSLLQKNRFSLAGMPFIHIAALLVLVGILIWALWVRDKPANQSGEVVTQLAGAPSPAPAVANNPGLPIEMKKLDPANPTPTEPAPADIPAAEATPAPAEAPAPTPAPEPAPIEPVGPVIAPTRAEPKPIAEPAAPEVKAAVETKTAAKVEAKPEPKVTAVTKPSPVTPDIAPVKPAATPKPEVKAEARPTVKPAPAETELAPAEELAAINRSAMAKPAGEALSVAAGTKKLAKLPETGYVLQLQISSSAKKIEEALAAAPNRKDLAAYRTLREGKEVFILVEGNYPDANSAAAAIKQLPAEQKAAQPWPKKVGLIHAELKAAGSKN